MDEKEIKQLELIQNIITRMNTNSFQIKGMTVIVVSATLAVYASGKDPDFLLITIIPLFLFWFLDAFYLQQERKFRGLYNNWVQGNPQKLKLFDFNIGLFKGGKYSFWSSFRSRTISVFYSGIFFAVLLFYLLTKTL